jgi:Holliday junction resolvase RusA-like endonuclease
VSTLTFTVIGQPGAQGSKRHVGRGIMVESSKKVTPWRQDVVAAAMKAAKDVGWDTVTAPVIVAVGFTFTRPKSHYRTGKNAHLLRDDAPHSVTSRSAGDLDKLLRSTFDALTTAGIWADDSLVADLHATKHYGAHAGAHIRIDTGGQR